MSNITSIGVLNPVILPSSFGTLRSEARPLNRTIHRCVHPATRWHLRDPTTMELMPSRHKMAVLALYLDDRGQHE